MSKAEGTLRKHFHGLTDEQFKEQLSKWPLNNVIGAMQTHTTATLEELKERVNKHFVYQIHNTDEETSKILEAVSDDVITLIEDMKDK